ncbi:MAG: hypothetical protein IT298_17190 [Chloroflexi bacterium]|nr:hypothetical protein [Anaerolineae bacterium]MCC6567494.1 hypothetical protein [Chloroflexota bacterium]OQY79262.1 MAG: hypothetical protein B6D42_15500 [Anaerolineae bacterium UTCFX5]MBW7880728.1 hypothetical protein [Anaerolineae bacterium]MCO6444423.1 hypothetical protein [Anaerolineae bacterium]
MGFFRRLFGGGRAVDRYVTYYVRPKRCSEVLAVRVDRYNDLSLSDDGKSYFVRKVARGERCPFPAELLIDFNGSRVEVHVDVQDGELVDEAAYQAYLGQRA